MYGVSHFQVHFSIKEKTMKAKSILSQVLFFTLLASVITFIGACATTAQEVAKAQPPAGVEVVEAPTFQVGNFWRYKYVNKEGGFASIVREIRDDKVIISPGVVWSKEGNLISGYGPVTGKSVTYDPAIPRLQFPLWVGKQWSVSYTAYSGSWSERYALEGKVVGRERIMVPAGAFEVLKLELRFSDGNQEVCWYAAEVKRFIKCQYADPSRDYELATFRLKPLLP